MTLTELESIVRNKIVEVAQSVENIGKALGSRRIIASLHDYLDVCGETITAEDGDEEIEIKLCTIEFAGFEDTDMGCDECPLVYLNYSICLEQQFVESRADGSNSSETFGQSVFGLRQKFLTRDALDLENVQNEKLTVRNSAAVNDKGISLAESHNIWFSLKVLVAPDCQE